VGPVKDGNNTIFFKPNAGAVALNNLTPNRNQQSLYATPLEGSQDRINKNGLQRFPVRRIHLRNGTLNWYHVKGFGR